MSISSSGGGYFYGPFASTDGFNYIGIAPGLFPAYGAWLHLAPPKPTRKGRWLVMTAWPQNILLPGVYRLQLGLGAPGAETLWQPSDGTGFYFDWFFSFPPFGIGFPISVRPGQNLSIRATCSVAPASPVDAHIYIFN